MKILVIEDNRDIAANIADYFEPRGHSLDFASDGPGGLRLATATAHDVIILDVMLPGLDGITLCRHLRTRAGLHTPVLMLTAKDELEDKLSGFAAGADDYLVKPFSMRELEVRLVALLKRANLTPMTRGPLLELADLSHNANTLETKRAGQSIELNPTQRKILEYLLHHHHRVVPRQELEFQIWEIYPRIAMRSGPTSTACAT
jgi:DNA-binding response OmpR family regulator